MLIVRKGELHDEYDARDSQLRQNWGKTICISLHVRRLIPISCQRN